MIGSAPASFKIDIKSLAQEGGFLGSTLVESLRTSSSTYCFNNGALEPFSAMYFVTNVYFKGNTNITEFKEKMSDLLKKIIGYLKHMKASSQITSKTSFIVETLKTYFDGNNTLYLDMDYFRDNTFYMTLDQDNYELMAIEGNSIIKKCQSFIFLI